MAGHSTISQESINYYATIKCSCCGSEVSLETILGQYAEGKYYWCIANLSGAKFCGYCSKELGLRDTRNDFN